MFRVRMQPVVSGLPTVEKSGKDQRGSFSLLELIVAIGIISAIALFTLAAIQAARRSASDVERLSWRRQRVLDEPPIRKIPYNILFIGNSHTVNGHIDIPDMLAVLSQAGGQAEIRPTRIVVGGRTLRGHWEDGRALELIKAPGPDWFDFVVLQGQSQEPCLLRSEYLEYSLRFAAACKETKAIPMIYQLFERSNGVCPQERLTSASADAVKQFQGNDGVGEICPVGEAWQAFRHARPDVELHQADGNHANEAGAYLTTCVFYSVVHRTSPIGLPNQVITRGGTVSVDHEIALSLQKQAWMIAQTWRAKTRPWFAQENNSR